MTSKLLQDVLPIDEPVNTFIIRQHVADVAERLEQEMALVSGLPPSSANQESSLTPENLPLLCS